MEKEKKSVIILGGGIAGLSAGFFAKKKGLEFDIYEAGDEPGGNCRTIVWNDFRFDTGAHRFHDKDPEMTREMLDLMGNKIREIQVPSFIFHRGKLIHFPLTPVNVFRQLSFMEILRSGWYFFYDKFFFRITDNFYSLACKKYGRLIAGMFLLNYSEKLWGEKCRDLSPDVAGSRLKDLNFSSMLTEFFFRKSKSKHLEGSFYYPHEGFGAIAREMTGFCGRENVHTGSSVTKINISGNRITDVVINGNEKIPADVFINTLPVSLLVRLMSPEPPERIRETVAKLKFRHLKLVVLLLDKKQVQHAATLYFPDNEYIFTRCYEPRNRSPRMSPGGKTSLVAEIPYSDLDTVSGMTDEELITRTKNDLISTKLINDHEILGSYAYTIPYAYPVLKNGYESEYKEIHDWLKNLENMHITGRNGRFEYSWVHNMMRWAHDIVEKIS